MENLPLMRTSHSHVDTECAGPGRRMTLTNSVSQVLAWRLRLPSSTCGGGAFFRRLMPARL